MDKENQQLLLSDFDYYLPKELIAQTPLLKRDESKLLVVNTKDKSLTDKKFYDIIDILKPGDVLVRNNSKVIPARLFGVKQETKGHIELLLLKQLENDIWECLIKGAKKVTNGTKLFFDESLKAEVVEKFDEGLCHIKFIYEGIFIEILEKLGTMPLPPYIKEKLNDQGRYQTVYAKVQGSSAAPTAGLHFTDDLFNKLKEKGVEVLDVTLHVGLGTFRPVEEENVLEHKMHEEYYILDSYVAERLNLAKKENRRIFSIGTTSLRTLETVYQKYKCFKADSGDTNIFIYPGKKVESITGLITNFHLPKSTLLMLVSAIATKEFIFKAYEHAIKNNYRFFSFGDAMIIL